VIDFVWYAYHPDIQATFLMVSVKTTDGNVSSALMTAYSFPVDEEKLYDLSDTTWAHSTSEQSNIRTNVRNRLDKWSLFVPYALRLDCAGLKYSQLCPGDIVTISLSQLDASNGYDEYYSHLSEVDGWTERQGMVTGVDVDYIAGMVTLELSVIPELE
jgi:hypothetical protein